MSYDPEYSNIMPALQKYCKQLKEEINLRNDELEHKKRFLILELTNFKIHKESKIKSQEEIFV